MQVLAATLVPEQSCVDASCNAFALAPKKRRAARTPVTECEHCAAPSVAEPTPVTPPAEITDASAPDSPESCVIPDATDAMSDDNDALWQYVVPCVAREAAKAIELRAALEAQCGKEVAKSLLANVKPTVAQDSCGKKNRVFKLGGSYVKLKSA